MSRLDLNLLIVLDAVLQTQSVTEAAKRVGLTKAAMSHALARVRAQLADPILVREGKEWTLTNRARNLVDPVHRAASSAREVLEPPSHFHAASSTAEFRIRMTDHALSILGPSLLNAVAQEAPGVTLRFLPVPDDDTVALRTARADMAIGVFASMPPAFRRQTLFDERFACVVRKEHPAVGATLSLSRYVSLKHVVVAPRGNPGSPVDDALRARGESRTVALYVPYFMAALEIVANSDYVLTMAERLLRAQRMRFNLALHPPPIALPTYTISQMWHPRADADPGHVWLRQLIARVSAPLARARGTLPHRIARP